MIKLISREFYIISIRIEMKFSFVNPSPTLELIKKVPTVWPPLGILYCAQVLKEGGVEVSVLDQPAKLDTVEGVVNWVKKEDPNIVGFSVLINTAKTAPQIAKRIKLQNPNIKIVFGSHHSTFNAIRILKKYPFIDIIVRGEGEYTNLEITECYKKQIGLNEVKGITYRKNNRIVTNIDRPLNEKIDDLPFPDRKISKVEYDLKIGQFKVNTSKVTTIISSRGCPFNCRFCGIRKFTKSVWRPRSVENVMAELQYLQGEGYEQFLFVDDNFTLDSKRVVRLCERIKKEGMDIEWFCDSRVDNVNLNMFKKMEKTGCKSLLFGIESANQRILDYYRKGITPDQARKAVTKARKANIDLIVGSFIVGALDETYNEVINTLNFANRLDLDVPEVNILRTHAGTDIWNELVAKGLLVEEIYWEDQIFIPKSFSTPVPYEKLRVLISQYFRSFYSNPEQVLVELLRSATSSFRTKVFLQNLSDIQKQQDQFIKLEEE